MQEMGSRVGLFFSCVAVALLTGAVPGVGMEAQQSPSVIELRCPQDVTRPEALCQSLAGTLKRWSPSSVVRTVQEGQGLRLRAGDLRVFLHVDAMTDDSLTAHLEWQVGEFGKVHKGPKVEFSVMDIELRPALFDQFADGLVKANPAFVETLP